MKKLFFLLVAVATLTITSCNNTKPAKEEVVEVVQDSLELETDTINVEQLEILPDSIQFYI